MLPYTKHKLSLVISAVLLTGAAHAQQDDKAKDEQAKEEKKIEVITVTASGRPQMASEIPMNISALTEAELRESRIGNLKDLIANSVEISSPGNSARFADSVSVRGLNVSGVNANNIQQFIRTTMAYYLDDTALPNINYRIKDIERVETLLGPQGTLYGAGSLGGTIRYITNQPVLDDFQFNFNSSLYQTKNGGISNDTDVVFNLPVSEKVAVRASLARLDEKGYTDRQVNPVWFSAGQGFPGNPVPSKTLYKDDDYQDVTGGKLAVLWQVSDDFKLTLSHIQQDQLAHGSNGASRLPVDRVCEDEDNCDVTSFDTPFQYNDHTIVARFEEYADRELSMDTLDLDWQLDGVKLHSSTSAYEDRSIGQADYASQGDAYYGWIPGLALADGNDSAYMTFDNTYKGLTHETRLTSDNKSDFSWIAGLYFTDQKRNFRFSEWFEQLDQIAAETSWAAIDRAVVGGVPGQGYEEDLGSKYKETAVFGEVGYDVTDKLNITLGARVFNYEDTGLALIKDYLGTTDSDREFSNSENGESFYKFNASYQFSEEVFAYFTYSQGFRRGGSNGFRDEGGQLVAADVQNYKPDSTDNMELGVKGYLADGWYVQTNIYQINWNNVQTYFSQTIDGIFPVNGTTNGPDAVTQGWELNTRYYLTDNITLSYATATTEGKWDETLTKCVYQDVAQADNECKTWTKGGLLGGSPKWRHNFGLRYDTDFENGMTAYTSLNGRYVSKVQNDRQDEPGAAVFEYPSYSTVSANIGFGKDNWDLTIWVQNLTDEDAIVSNLNSGVLGRRTIALVPRTMGLNFSYKY